jgi:uncharacterized protein
LEEGTLLVRTARKAIETYLRDDKIMERPEVSRKFLDRCGTFVTLTKNNELRGCIGQPIPVMPLIDALIDSAISAATRDPRFPELELGELSEVEIEVSVLTKPEIMKVKHPKDYPGLIAIGRDGLIIEYGANAGLLLPQVPVEWNWDAEEFLSNACLKAGLPPDFWLDKRVRVQKFSAQVFSEREPRGKIEERKLTK